MVGRATRALRSPASASHCYIMSTGLLACYWRRAAAAAALQRAPFAVTAKPNRTLTWPSGRTRVARPASWGTKCRRRRRRPVALLPCLCGSTARIGAAAFEWLELEVSRLVSAAAAAQTLPAELPAGRSLQSATTTRQRFCPRNEAKISYDCVWFASSRRSTPTRVSSCRSRAQFLYHSS